MTAKAAPKFCRKVTALVKPHANATASMLQSVASDWLRRAPFCGGRCRLGSTP